ncbi:glycosyltransferase, partial [Sphingomonas sp.]|uniref:glycosyltransferase n=1 Tax=Sphingomonas sp. TaxID=28214 RepID=UPI001ECC5299
IVGGDDASDYVAGLNDYARQLDVYEHIVWAGPCDDMTAVYSALNILCLCSVSEGFPNVVAEAMSAGLPCVASNVGDTARLIGDAGWVVTPNDAAALTAALRAAMVALDGWDHRRPRNHIIENFSVACLKTRTLDALRPYLVK